MGSVIHLHEPGIGHMGVDLGCRKTHMAKNLLDAPKISPGIEHVGCKAVANGVGGNGHTKSAIFDKSGKHPSN